MLRTACHRVGRGCHVTSLPPLTSSLDWVRISRTPYFRRGPRPGSRPQGTTEGSSMPVDFLTTEQEQRYGRYTGVPSEAELAQHFYLDARDQTLIGQRRGDLSRLGFAVQLCTVRFVGTFLSDPTEVPSEVVAYVAAQLGISDTSQLLRYREGPLHYEHADEIRYRYGYHEFTDR